jgi:hypothetical protein
VSGLVLAHGVTTNYAPSWWMGVICLVVSLALVAAGLVSSRARGRTIALTSEAAPSEEPRDPRMPMLGALLVHKYQVITEGQLKQILAQQEKQRPDRPRLGDMLVSMGLITKDQLREALRFQQAQAQRRQARPGSTSD